MVRIVKRIFTILRHEIFTVYWNSWLSLWQWKEFQPGYYLTNIYIYIKRSICPKPSPIYMGRGSVPKRITCQVVLKHSRVLTIRGIVLLIQSTYNYITASWSTCYDYCPIKRWKYISKRVSVWQTERMNFTYAGISASHFRYK